MVAEKIGTRFMRERLARVIPFVGALSGGALNFMSVRAVGRAAIRYYESLIDTDVAEAIWAGAKLYVASDVPFFATRHGRSMGYSYAIVGAIRRMTKAPMILTGKPSLHALRFIAKKLCERFVSDQPPPALVERVAQVFLRSDGDISEVLRAIFTSPPATALFP